MKLHTKFINVRVGLYISKTEVESILAFILMELSTFFILISVAERILFLNLYLSDKKFDIMVKFCVVQARRIYPAFIMLIFERMEVIVASEHQTHVMTKPKY